MLKKWRPFIIIISAIVFVVSAGQIAWHYYQLYAGDRAYEDIRDETVAEEPAAPAEDKFSTIGVNFDLLEGINPDIIGWLYIPNTHVSYPILHGESNQTYLRTTYDKKSNILGSIFEDYRNDMDFKDLNTIIYGHNTSTDSMFGSLKKYKAQDYAEQHPNVQIIRKNDVQVYEIFTVYETLATSDTYTIKFASDESYASYLDAMTSKSLVSIGSPPANGEPIITLSTCTGGAKTMRLVLQARLIETHTY